MGEILNLRQARKAKARAEADKLARENRAAFGRSKAKKKLAKAERDAATRKLDGHKHERKRDE